MNGIERVARFEEYILYRRMSQPRFRLYAQEELHPGFVVILPGELRIKEQLELFGLVLDRMDREEDQYLVNKVLIVDRDGKISIVDWSKNYTNSQLPPGL